MQERGAHGICNDQSDFQIANLYELGLCERILAQ